MMSSSYSIFLFFLAISTIYRICDHILVGNFDTKEKNKTFNEALLGGKKHRNQKEMM